MTRLPPLAAPRVLWIAGMLLGVLAGVAAVAPTSWVVAAAGGVVAIAVLARRFPGTALTEWVVAAYWIAFTLFTTVLRAQTFGGLFYPFYVALFLGAIALLALGGLKVDATVAWAYVVLLFAHVASLAGSTIALDAAALDRLVVIPFGALVLLQFRSLRGVRLVTAAAVVSSLAVAVWVIVRAVQGDFAARAALDVNQNVASFYICIGLLVAFADGLQSRGGGGGRSALTGLARILAMGVMSYAIVLLASRGMIISLTLAVAALLVRAALIDRRNLAIFAVFLVIVPVGLLLPGGLGIVERFEDPNIATGGGRTLIWAAVGEELAASSAGELLLGHGFETSRALVERRFAPLGSTHNGYLQILYDLGVVGLAAFLVLHAHVLLRSLRDGTSDWATLAGVTVFLLTANLVMSAPEGYLYWATLGMLLAMATWQRGPVDGPAA